MTLVRFLLLLLLLGGVVFVQYLWRMWVPTLPPPQRWKVRLLAAAAGVVWFGVVYFIAVQTAVAPNS